MSETVKLLEEQAIEHNRTIEMMLAQACELERRLTILAGELKLERLKNTASSSEVIGHLTATINILVGAKHG